MRAVLALLILVLPGCARDLPPAGTYRETVIASGGDASAGWQITYKPARTERRYAGIEMVICPTEWMLKRYIDWGTLDGCRIGYLTGDPTPDQYKGVRVWYDLSPWDGYSATRYEK